LFLNRLMIKRPRALLPAVWAWGFANAFFFPENRPGIRLFSPPLLQFLPPYSVYFRRSAGQIFDYRPFCFFANFLNHVRANLFWSFRKAAFSPLPPPMKVPPFRRESKSRITLKDRRDFEPSGLVRTPDPPSFPARWGRALPNSSPPLYSGWMKTPAGCFFEVLSLFSFGAGSRLFCFSFLSPCFFPVGVGHRCASYYLSLWTPPRFSLIAKNSGLWNTHSPNLVPFRNPSPRKKAEEPPPLNIPLHRKELWKNRKESAVFLPLGAFTPSPPFSLPFSPRPPNELFILFFRRQQRSPLLALH